MKRKVRYDNAYQTLELNAKETEGLWISLSLEGDGLSQEDFEKLIQDEWEERYNKPDYNSWHKFDRHRGDSKAQPGKDEDDERRVHDHLEGADGGGDVGTVPAE